jgi:hypothetical protein
MELAVFRRRKTRRRLQTREARLVPLAMSFGIASFVLTVILGVVLGGQVKREVTNRSITGSFSLI